MYRHDLVHNAHLLPATNHNASTLPCHRVQDRDQSQRQVPRFEKRLRPMQQLRLAKPLSDCDHLVFLADANPTETRIHDTIDYVSRSREDLLFNKSTGFCTTDNTQSHSYDCDHGLLIFLHLALSNPSLPRMLRIEPQKGSFPRSFLPLSNKCGALFVTGISLYRWNA